MGLKTIGVGALLATLALTAACDSQIGQQLNDCRDQVSKLQKENIELKTALAQKSSDLDTANEQLATTREELHHLKYPQDVNPTTEVTPLGTLYGVRESGFMQIAAKWVVLILVVIGLGALCVSIIVLIFQGGTSIEITLRLLSLMVGLLIYFGARALEVSIPQLMFKALTDSGPLTFTIVSAITGIPAGIAVAWYIKRMLKSGSRISHRIAILLAVVITTLFVELLAQAFTQGVSITTLAPNLTFTIGMGLYIILTYEGD